MDRDPGFSAEKRLPLPELRGFEVFCIGRPAEDMPQITSRICGVCPTAHHVAATKALDDLYQVEPPPAARKIRELIYSAFMVEDHALHFNILGGPDFVVGPDAPPEQRNVIGVIQKVGVEVGRKVISMRRQLRELIAYFGGKVIHPGFGPPGGVSKGLAAADLPKFQELGKDALEFALFTLQVFKDIVLRNVHYANLITSDTYTHRTYYMGLVDANNKVNFYDGLATPQAQQACDEFFSTLGGKPVHHTLANHWARVVEIVYAAERLVELLNDPEITSSDLRVIPSKKPSVGIGVVEAPRGTLFHHYETDERGLITKANLIVATQNNAARIALSVEKAAQGLIKKGQVSEGLLNRVEMAFRAYDPCFGCATHSLPGHLPLCVSIYDRQRNLVQQLVQS